MVNPVFNPDIVIAVLSPAQNDVLGAFSEGAAITFDIGEVTVQPLFEIATL